MYNDNIMYEVIFFVWPDTGLGYVQGVPRRSERLTLKFCHFRCSLNTVYRIVGSKDF